MRKPSNRLQPHNRAAAVALSVGLAALVTVSANAAADITPATPAAAPRGAIHLLEVGGISGVDEDVITGAITDHGVDHLGIADHGNINKLVLANGSFKLNITKLNQKIKPTSVDSTHCSLVVAGTGPTTLFDGTGAYKGISGTLTATVHEAKLVPRNSNGSCNLNEAAPPVAEVITAAASGKVSFK
jgi:hypothetical protein